MGHPSVLQPETLAIMFDSHSAGPSVPGMGGVLRGDEGGHRTVGHDGIVSGFLSQLTIAPEDGIGVVVLGNTGALDGRGAPQPLGTALLRRLLSLPDTGLRPTCCPGQRPGLTSVDGTARTGHGHEPLHPRLHGRRSRGHGGRQPPGARHSDPSATPRLALYPDAADDPKVFRLTSPSSVRERCRWSSAAAPALKRPLSGCSST